MWQRLTAAVTGRRSWRLGSAAVLLGIGFIVLIGGNAAAGQAPLSVPVGSDSAKLDALARQFPGGDRVPLLLVVSRADGAALNSDDIAAARGARPPMVSADGKAAIGVVPIRADLSGMVLSDGVTALRTAANAGLPSGLQAHVTGGPAFGADIANAFTDANITLLAVTASVVALLLIATYRSPVLWLAPLLVIAFADRVAAALGTAVASLTGLSFDGATSGITSVLVFGAGTNYALLLISRYRQELRSHAEHRDALRRAVRAAGPAIVASNATVVLALLTLLFASTPSTRSLGALAACGLVVAAGSVLVVLPPLLALCGRRLFWPLIPQADGAATVDSGAWHRVAERVARRPAVVAAVAIAVLAALASGLLGTRIGLSQTEQFRVQADSVSGYDVLAAHFPPGLANPTLVVAPTARASQVRAAIVSTPGVVSVTEAGQSTSGLTKWSVVTESAPSSDRAFATVAALRNSTKSAAPDALVGGPDAAALDVRDAAAHDRLMLIPAILAVILGGRATDSADRNNPRCAGCARPRQLDQPARLRVSRPGQQYPALRVPVPGRSRRGLHHLSGHPCARGGGAARRPRRHGPRGVGHRWRHHQRGSRFGRRVLRAGGIAADRDGAARHHRRPWHPARHLRGAHAGHPRAVRLDRSGHLVAHRPGQR
jgi:RND superfamily putative drug exporter